MDKWYGDRSRRKLIRRADAFAQARSGDAAVVPALLEIVADRSEGPLVRTNAAGYLSRFATDPRVSPVLLWALGDSQPPVRAAAAIGLGGRTADQPATVKALVRALEDSVGTVRLSAAVSLVSLGVRQLPGEDGQRFERAKQAYSARASLNSHDAQQQFAAGKFYFLTGDAAKAIAAWNASLKLDPETPAKLYLASAYLQQGRSTDARQLLEAVAPADPQYERAQALLKTLPH